MILAFTKSFKKQVISNGDASDPYLVRWAINTPLGGVKLHHFLRSDDDRDLHDHPWSFLAIILLGGYWEHRAAACAQHPVPGKPHSLNVRTHYRDHVAVCRWCGAPRSAWTVRRWRRPGSVLWRPAPSVHRVELPAGRTSWSLVFSGPKKREWGFHTVCGFIPWTRYAKAKQEGC